MSTQLVDVRHGDCAEVIRTLADASLDSCVTDPPYALISISKRFGKVGRTDSTITKAHPYQRHARGFMNKQWDNGTVAFSPEFWAEVYRVLKPGAHVVAFGGTRTYHRLACAIEDAGFEIRDQIGWLYGSGFPKSHNAGNGWGTALKPAWEPIVLARKPLIGTVAANVLEHGTGAINIDASRVATEDALGGGAEKPSTDARYKVEGWDRPWMHNEAAVEAHSARVRDNVEKAEKLGRWPANIIHDGSQEVIDSFPEASGQQQDIDPTAPSEKTSTVYGKMKREGEASASRRYTEEGSTNFAALPGQRRLDAGSAARFFYSAKATSEDRLDSKHPTVKPIDLMAYLCRLVTPTGGTVLDPFAGSGTTGMACMREGFKAILIEREDEYVADIKRRLAHVHGTDTPLFANPIPTHPAFTPDPPHPLDLPDFLRRPLPVLP